jgi:hypothetical protein
VKSSEASLKINGRIIPGIPRRAPGIRTAKQKTLGLIERKRKKQGILKPPIRRNDIN